MFRQIAVGVVAAAMVASVARAQSADKDIVDTAVAAGSFKMLAKALQTADPVGTLKERGLPKAALDALNPMWAPYSCAPEDHHSI